jgi:hypothetical protein
MRGVVEIQSDGKRKLFLDDHLLKGLLIKHDRLLQLISPEILDEPLMKIEIFF